MQTCANCNVCMFSRLSVFRDRLSASDMLQVRKVMEHVYEKIINLDSESQTSGSAGEKPSEQKEEEDMAVLAEEKIELLCQDQVKPIVTFIIQLIDRFIQTLETSAKSESTLVYQVWIRCRSKASGFLYLYSLILP